MLLIYFLDGMHKTLAKEKRKPQPYPEQALHGLDYLMEKLAHIAHAP